jgi:hypothetical protein
MSHSNIIPNRVDDRHHDIQKYRHPMIFPGIAGTAIVAVLVMYVLERAFN